MLDSRVQSFSDALVTAIRAHRDVDRQILGLYLLVAIAGLLEAELGRVPTPNEFDRELWLLRQALELNGRVQTPTLRLVQGGRKS